MSKIQTAIISSDQVLTRNIAKDLKENNASKVITFVTDENYLSNIEFPNLPGKHNKQNITAAFLACKELGVSEKNIIDAIKTFKPLAHRTEFVEKLGNTRFVNDSKATNAEATKPALKTYKNIYWLAGGIPKKGGLERILGDLENVKKSYLFGEAAAVFEESLKNIGNRNYEICVNLKEAFHKAVLDASIDSNENVVLLSPACSSFDEFKNFEERGEYFKKLVMELKPTGTTEVKKVS